MTAPIETAYTALGDMLDEALALAGFITEGALKRDPQNRWEPEGEETEVQTAAALFSLNTEAVRTLLGGGVRRFVVERTCRLELAAVGPVPAGEDNHETRLLAVLDLVAPLSEADPTLGQTCERLVLTTLEDEDLDPGGLKKAITFTIRLRSGDRLGRTAP